MWWPILKILFGCSATWMASSLLRRRDVPPSTILLCFSVAGIAITSGFHDFAPRAPFRALQLLSTLGLLAAFVAQLWAQHSHEFSRLPFLPNTPVPSKYRPLCIASSSVILAAFLSLALLPFTFVEPPSLLGGIASTVAALLALVGASMLLRTMHLVKRYHARATSGLCGACGYDLRGSASVCPECAEPFNSTRSSAAG